MSPMPQLWIYLLIGLALLIALASVVVASRMSRALRLHAGAQRWLQGQLERMESEQRSLESALIGLGNHIDSLDTRLKAQQQRHDQVASRLDALALSDEDDRSFTHAMRLAAQGRVSLRELIDDFGLSESEADLLMRMNQTDRSATDAPASMGNTGSVGGPGSGELR